MTVLESFGLWANILDPGYVIDRNSIGSISITC